MHTKVPARHQDLMLVVAFALVLLSFVDDVLLLVDDLGLLVLNEGIYEPVLPVGESLPQVIVLLLDKDSLEEEGCCSCDDICC